MISRIFILNIPRNCLTCNIEGIYMYAPAEKPIGGNLDKWVTWLTTRARMKHIVASCDYNMKCNYIFVNIYILFVNIYIQTQLSSEKE